MIVYRIIYPWGIATVFFFLCSLIEYSSIGKTNKKKKELIKRKKLVTIGCIIMAITSFVFMAYISFDLILPDPVTRQGYYLRQYSSGFVWKLQFSKNGEVETIHSTQSYEDELVPGEQYEYTYAKRSKMLLEIRELPEE